MIQRTYFSLIIFPVALFSQSLTLNEAVKTALAKNDKIAQYQERLEQKQYENNAAWGNFAPSISLTGSYTHINEPISLDLNPIRDAMIQIQTGNQVELTNIGAILKGLPPLTAAERAATARAASAQLNSLIPSFVEQVKAQDYKTATFTGIQPLFTGGKLLAAKKFASAEEEAALVDLKRTQDEISNSVITTYLNVALLNDVVRIRKEVLNGMKRHRTQAERLVENGLIAKYQFYRAEVAVSEAENNLFDDENKLQLALLSLRSTMGVDESYPTEISDSLCYISFSSTIDTLQAAAEREQPLLQIISLKRDAAEQKYNAERAEFLPQIAAFGKYELFPEYLSLLEPRWAVGIQFQFPLFNGFKRYSKMESAVHLEQEVEHIEIDLKRTVRLWINKTFRTVQNAKDKYIKLESNESLAKENLRLTEKRFETGMSTSLEVIDAELALEKVTIDRAKTLTEYYQAISELSVASGNIQLMLSLWNSTQHSI